MGRVGGELGKGKLSSKVETEIGRDAAEERGSDETGGRGRGRKEEKRAERKRQREKREKEIERGIRE